MSQKKPKAFTHEPPAMGERRARWGYGYQDKVATERTLDLLRKELREGAGGFEGIRLADLDAGRVDDFVIVWLDSVEGNSIKWSTNAAPITWGDLIGASGLLRELADGSMRLRIKWPKRTVDVRLHTNRPASVEKHPSQLITTISVSDFLANHWSTGPHQSASAETAEAWRKIAEHLGLSGPDLSAFVSSCTLSLGQPEPPGSGQETLDWKRYRQQFDSLHKAIATWLTNMPTQDFIDRDYLLTAIGVRASRSGLIQRFPEPDIPYEKNHAAAGRLKDLIDSTPGGYLGVLGPAGVGKSTLVQDVLTDSGYPFFVPYYAFLPSTDGSRDRGEALTFFQDVIGRLDRFHTDRYSLGISDLAQGRDALRRHMAKANEGYVLHGRKTILLVDGLDHVIREVNLQTPVLHELPRPDEIPDGFVIVLSGQPQAFEAGEIPVHVAAALAQESRRLEVAGLSRTEVHALISRLGRPTTAIEKDAFHSACLGNPLILTYLLAEFERTAATTVGDAIERVGHYEGKLDQYYQERLARPLQDAETRRLLGLLARAAPTIPVGWLQEWPEGGMIEDVYRRVLAPFVRIEEGSVQFIHDSLIAFLKAETRSRLPGGDATGEERAFYSALADRSSGRACIDPVGRARILHLLRANRHADLLAQLSSPWLREATLGFLPYAHLHPILLTGLAAAWATGKWGDVLRLILLSHELEQRTSRLDATSLAEAFLGLDAAPLALSQIRFGGRLLVDDNAALRFAGSLWWYAHKRGQPELKLVARSLYLQAKPISLLYQPEAIDTESHHPDQESLSFWSEVAVLFEQPAAIAGQIQSLQFAQRQAGDQPDSATVKAQLLFRALGVALDAGREGPECQVLVDAILTCGLPTWSFLALFRLAEAGESEVGEDALLRAYGDAQTNNDLDLAFAQFLIDRQRQVEALEIARGLRHIRFDFYGRPHSWGFTDVTYTVRLRWVQELLEIAEGPVPVVTDDREEAGARAEHAARQLGFLNAKPEALIGAQGRELFRSLLLFHNRRVQFDTLGRPHDHVPMTWRSSIYHQLVQISEVTDAGALATLRDVVIELVSGPAATQFTPGHRRYFALVFYQRGIISREDATELGLSSTADSIDDDPGQRQEACLEIATFLHRIGDESGAQHWVARGSKSSAGAGSHKDYHMEYVADWLARSIDRAGPDELHVLDELARALEVAGGRGGPKGAAAELQLLLRIDPARAGHLAIEWIDRQVLNVAGALGALIVGGAAVGAGPALLIAIYDELYSLVATGDTSAAALAVVRSFPRGRRPEIAVRLMSCARTNTLPSYRAEVARALEDELQKEGLGEQVLSRGLAPGRDESSLTSTLYRTAEGGIETAEHVAARLSDQDHPEAWDPNPGGNAEFDWWAAIRKARVRSLAHLDSLVARFPPPAYREVELLALRADLLREVRDDRNAARELAEEAISRAKDGSWHRWFDGASKRIAFGALKRIDRTEAIARAREQFSKDLAAGRLINSYLLPDIGDAFDLMEIGWPADSVVATVKDYLEQVLLGNQQVPQYEALKRSAPSWSADQALCRFIAEMVACPIVDIAVSARRVLAQYIANDGSGFIALLTDGPWWDPVQLERLLAAVHVGSRSDTANIGALRRWIESLNGSESLGVRGIATRICSEQGWEWADITSRPPQPVILLSPSLYPEGGEGLLLGEDVNIAWNLHRPLFASLEHAGLEPRELRSEFERIYRTLEGEYSWADRARLERWLKMLSARFWLNPRAVLGREASMRVFGRRSLSGQVPPGAEAAYDQFFPIYDRDLEVRQPTERPSELQGMDWRIGDRKGDAWLNGAHADTWGDYPESVSGFRIIGERTWLIRPEWGWPREERYRGLTDRSLRRASERQALNSAYELTYEAYLGGNGQSDDQLIVLNDERQLSGPAYRWAAISSSLARALGWSPSKELPFQWEDASGDLMVKSTYWKDGWIWLEPPRFESLGEGWLVLASPAAVDAMRQFAPEAEVHLWVERYSHGERPYEGRWHLSKPLHLS